MAISDLLIQLNNVKLAIKQAIINKGVSMDGVAFTDYATKIGSIIKSQGNAVASDVLNGKTFSNASSNSLTGSMTNNGAVTKTFTPSTSSQSYTIPKGYHNGNGKVTCNAILKEIAIISCEKGIATVCGFGKLGGTWAEYHGITTGYVGDYVKTYRSGNYCYIEVTKACKGFDKTLTLKSYSVGTKLSVNVSNESSTNFLVVVSG